MPSAGGKDVSDTNTSAKKFHKIDKVLFFMAVDNLSWIPVQALDLTKATEVRRISPFGPSFFIRTVSSFRIESVVLLWKL